MIPRSLQTKVCMCKESSGVMRGATKQTMRMQSCKDCRKPFRWYVRRCTECKSWFIHDFYFAAYECARHTRCWTCIQETEPCADLLGKQVNTIRDFGPLGLNPRKFTREELDSAFDWVSPF